MTRPVKDNAWYEQCPHCGQTVDVHFRGLCSHLGSPSTICRRCATEVSVERVEWRDMSVQQKKWFRDISLVYVGILGFLGGYSFGITRDFWLREPLKDEIPDFTGPVFLTGFILWGSLVVLLQGYRVFSSIRRSRKLHYEPSPFFWNLQTWVQFKCLLLLMFFPFLSWLIRKVGG